MNGRVVTVGNHGVWVKAEAACTLPVGVYNEHIPKAKDEEEWGPIASTRK